MTSLQRQILQDMHKEIGIWLDNDCNLAADCILKNVKETLTIWPSALILSIGVQLGKIDKEHQAK